MTIELLNKEHLSAFKGSIDSIKDRAIIVSPFIGFETSKQLVNSLKGRHVDCTIITRFYREDFLNHTSSLDGLKLLANAGFKIYALKGLHSKLYVFDKDCAILGSANFTMGGFKFNHELSLFIEEEDELISKLSDFCDELLNNIIESGEWQITLDQIEKEISLVDYLSKNRKDKNIKYANNVQYGATLSKNITINETDVIEKIIRESVDSGFENGIWLKFVGSGNDRYKPDKKYSPERLISNGKKITSFPRNPRGILENDYIYLSAISWDMKNVATPMIVGRARTKGFKQENSATEDDFKQYVWMSDYPYYIELYDVEILNADVGDCISLDRVIREIGTALYPTTQGMNLSVSEIKSRHYQKSHLRITPTAKSHIDVLFEEIMKSKGIIKF